MRRRRRWLGALAVLGLAFGLPHPAHGAATPVMTGDRPDPAIVRDGSTYYLFTTNHAYANVPIASSEDLDHWHDAGDALPVLGAWATKGFTWAPAVEQFGATWQLYYTAQAASEGRQCIGRAQADSPTGPYVDGSPTPLVCQVEHGGSIDASVYVDASKQPWLLWKSDDNAIGAASHLWSQQLSADGTALVGARHELLVADQQWEFPTIEAPELVAGGGRLFLFYSGGWWESTSYAIGYGVCSSPAGPCTKQTTTAPWLSTANSGLAGPGSASMTTSIYGTDVMAFAAWIKAVGYAGGGVRAPFVEPVDLRGPIPQYRPDRPRQGPIDVVMGWALRSTPSAGAPTAAFLYGAPYDQPVPGQWNTAGVDAPGVYENGWWYLRSSVEAGAPDITVHYGTTGYIPVVGDWNADTHSDVGVYDNGWWYLRTSATPGPPDIIINYGYPGAVPVVGDWDGDGHSDVGVYDNGWWYLRTSATPGPPEITVNYGTTGYRPLVGRWSAGADDGIGVAYAY